MKRVTTKVMVVQANALNLYLSLLVYVCLLCMVLQEFSFCAMELLIVDCNVSPFDCDQRLSPSILSIHVLADTSFI